MSAERHNGEVSFDLVFRLICLVHAENIQEMVS